MLTLEEQVLKTNGSNALGSRNPDVNIKVLIPASLDFA
jgi:hypothetical protein